MEKNTQQELMKKVASYIESTQPVIDDFNEQRSKFVKRATQAAGVLSHRGIIDSRRVNEFIDKIAEDPSQVWEFVEKMAAALTVDGMGEAVHTKVASENADAFERAFFGLGTVQPGMVD